jgi:hypothetical protein
MNLPALCCRKIQYAFASIKADPFHSGPVR